MNPVVFKFKIPGDAQIRADDVAMKFWKALYKRFGKWVQST